MSTTWLGCQRLTVPRLNNNCYTWRSIQFHSWKKSNLQLETNVATFYVCRKKITSQWRHHRHVVEFMGISFQMTASIGEEWLSLVFFTSHFMIMWFDNLISLLLHNMVCISLLHLAKSDNNRNLEQNTWLNGIIDNNSIIIM